MKRINKLSIIGEKNVFVLGGDRDYKLLIKRPTLLQSNGSFIITETCYEEALAFYRTSLEKKGYKLKILDLVCMKNSACYNPFHYIRKDEDVITLVDLLIKSTQFLLRGCKSIGEKLETALLQAICFYIKTELPEEKQNFSTVIKLLEEASTDAGKGDQSSVLDVIMEQLREKDPVHLAVKQYEFFKSYSDRELRRNVLISCSIRLQPFRIIDVKQLTCSDNIDLDSLLTEKTALFCILSPTNPVFNFLVNILYGQLYELSTDLNRMKINGDKLPIRFMIDDSSLIGFIPRLEEKICVGRVYGISWTIKYSLLSLLKQEYEKEWQSILYYMDSIVFLKEVNSETYDFFMQFNKRIQYSGTRLYGLKIRTNKQNNKK